MDREYPLIGLFGASGAGKSTVAKKLSAMFCYEVVPMSCVLKDMLRALGFTEADLEGDQDYRLTPQDRLGGMSPREVAQSLGTQWARNIVHPDLLVNAVRERLYQKVARGARIVVDGMRFPNEAEMVRSLGGEIWTVERPGHAPRQTVFDHLAANAGWFPRIHESEYHWPHIRADLRLVNRGSVPDLHRDTINGVLTYHQRSLNRV